MGRGGVARLPSSEPARPADRVSDAPSNSRISNDSIAGFIRNRLPAHNHVVSTTCTRTGDLMPRELATARNQADVNGSHGVSPTTG